MDQIRESNTAVGGIKMLELNQEQKLATKHSSACLLVLAGPGTGKTSNLVGRYLYY